MIQYIESALIILGAFQPLITFFIGLCAIYISTLTFNNAKIARLHNESCQLFSLKRDCRILLFQIVNTQRKCVQDLEDAFISLKIEIKALSKDDDSVTKVKQFLDEQKEILEEFVIFSDRNVVLISNLKSILEAEDLLLKIEKKNVNGIANAALQTSRFDLYTKIIVKTDDVAADNEKLKRESEQLKSKISKYEDSIENEKK